MKKKKKKFFQQVVDHRKLLMVIFIAAALICAVLQNFVAVDYDVTDYLPEDSSSTVSLNKMDEEFDGSIPNARVMIKNVSIADALTYKSELEAIDGVTDVTWLDDASSTTVPIETLDTDTVETYYKDGNALFSVSISEDKRLEAVEDIRELIGDDNAMSGSAVSTAVATTSTVSEVAKISVYAVLFVLLVLTVTTTSWLEPVVILLGLGTAVIINMGTNIIFGEISFVTNAAGSILQLAVSLDYSVFLFHRFLETTKTIKDPKEAMVDALTKSSSSILASGMTTVIGFLALVLMRFRIGPDLGLALAKGVGISLLTVFFFMPGLILASYPLIQKTRHRRFVPSFRKFGELIIKIMVPVSVIFLFLIVPAYLASNSNSFYYGASHLFGPETQLGQDIEEIEDVFGKGDTYVMMVPRGDTAKEKELSDKLQELPQVKSVISYVDLAGPEVPDTYLEADQLSQLESDNYSRMVISVEADLEGDETFDLIREIRADAQEYYPDTWYLAGEGVSAYDLMDTITADTAKVNLVAIAAVFLVLLLTMKSVTLPVILVLGIETAIWINLSVPYFTGQHVFYIAYLIISSIQLGATVDYAILFSDRYSEYREQYGRRRSIVETVTSCSVSILTSASVLTVVGFLLGMLSTHGLISQLGYFLGIGTLCSLCVVMFVLPGLLYLTDGLQEKTRIGKNRRKERIHENHQKLKRHLKARVQEIRSSEES